MGDDDEDQCKPQKFKMYTVARALVMNPLVQIDKEIINCGDFSGSVGGQKGMGHLDMVPLPRQVVHMALKKWYAKNKKEFKEYAASFAEDPCQASAMFNSSSDLGTSWFETAQAAFGAAGAAAWMNPGRCGPEGEGKFGWRVARLKEMVKNAKLVDSEGETDSIAVLLLKKENQELKAALSRINTATGGQLLWDEAAEKQRVIKVHARWEQKWNVKIQYIKGVETITLTPSKSAAPCAAPCAAGAARAVARPRSPSASSGASESEPPPLVPDRRGPRRSCRALIGGDGGEESELPWLLRTITAAVSVVDGTQHGQLGNADVLKLNALLISPELVQSPTKLPPYIYALVSLQRARLKLVPAEPHLVPAVPPGSVAVAVAAPAAGSAAWPMTMRDSKRLVFVDPEILGLVCDATEAGENVQCEKGPPPAGKEDLFASIGNTFSHCFVLALPPAAGVGGTWTYHSIPQPAS